MNTQKLVEFLEKNGKEDFVKANDFLKSLYPVPKVGEVPGWTSQPEMKKMRAWLNGLVDSRQIAVKSNTHNDLGRTYYEGAQQYQRHHNLATLNLHIKMGLDK